ncbi:hypothetical protein H5410_046869 [Solanum commersonii]|uniref:Uncharacterized protein n=1 Tax=Solanum commersonii TaxID=4109 RepID=A0A9J5XDH4_SOLCO|nr:hypothetical protein H5410_046869 [Solanum commersonii]
MRATTSPANNNQHERQLRRATGETSAHQQQRQQRTSEILTTPFLSFPTKLEFKDGSQQIRPRVLSICDFKTRLNLGH